MTRLKPLVAIDPGLNSMGVAYWDTPSSIMPSRTFLIKAPHQKLFWDRALWICGKLENELTLYDGKGYDLVCEYPSYHGSIRGWATGDLQRLVLLVGVLVGYFRAARWTLVTPRDWKGQLSKEVVIRRLQKRFGPGATIDWEKDVWDAVGIGLWKMGKF